MLKSRGALIIDTPSVLEWKGNLLKIVAVGGTFDELHKGHKTLLETAFKIGETVWIGLSTDEFAKTLRKNHEIAPYKDRLRNLTRFLESLGVLNRAKIVPLNDPYGPALSNPKIEGIVVSRETETRAKEINVLREKRGLKPLKIIVIDMVLAEDQVPISTTRIRRGEIDHEGRLIRKKRNI
ncbi:MAG: phosphopantetheine adenylyltransferase [Candidatus Bathyarchaeia archaeon]|nr:phosphopantetheine adenylyltransferase [Candidatus Bathyarchaeota archaeon]